MTCLVEQWVPFNGVLINQSINQALRLNSNSLCLTQSKCWITFFYRVLVTNGTHFLVQILLMDINCNALSKLLLLLIVYKSNFIVFTSSLTSRHLMKRWEVVRWCLCASCLQHLHPHLHHHLHHSLHPIPS